jgi:HD superfamily phosphohydrolase
LPKKWTYKLVRCPLYGFAGISKLEDHLLSTIAMQRLSRIKQLAHTYIVYPSAVHTRLEHSIGSLCLAGRICDQLELSQKKKKLVRIAALLHDIGHGPFSHIWEKPMQWINGEDFCHEDVTKLIIKNDTQISKLLRGIQDELLGIFDGKSLSSDIISGSLDVDKLDYLRRDSYHTGVAYSPFDIERIIRTLCKISENGRDYLAIDEKGKNALESYRLARYSMHLQVYEHHTRLVADDMFLKAIKLALDEEDCLPKESFDISQSNFVENYLKFDDFSVQHEILQNSDGLAKELINDIRNRKLLKRAVVVPLTKVGVGNAIRRKKLTEMSAEEIETSEKKIANEVGIDPAYIIVHLQSIKIKLYERFEQTMGKKEKPIYVKSRNNRVYSFDEESPFSAALTPIRKLYVFCPEKKISQTKSVAKELFGIKSEI